MQKELASISIQPDFFKTNKVELFDQNDFVGFVHDYLGRKSSPPSSSSYIVDIGKVIQTVLFWRENFQDLNLVYQACSAMDDLMIKLLNQQGIIFSVFSLGDMEGLISLGVDPDNVFYSSFCKTNRHVKISKEMGINKITFSSNFELLRLAPLHPDASYFLRIKVSHEVIDYNCYNMMLGTAASLNLNVEGIQLYVDELENGDLHSEQILEQLSCIVFNISNFSSSLKSVSIVAPHLFQREKLCGDYLNTVKAAFVEMKFLCPHLKFYVEAGDTLLCSGTQLFCTVTGVKSVNYDGTDVKEQFYFLNDGVYGSFSSVIHKSVLPKPTVMKKTDIEHAQTSSAILWGPTCDSIDKICSIKDFPLLEVGDIVAFDVSDGGCRACATTFNGFPIPEVVYAVSYQCLEVLGGSPFHKS